MVSQREHFSLHQQHFNKPIALQQKKINIIPLATKFLFLNYHLHYLKMVKFFVFLNSI